MRESIDGLSWGRMARNHGPHAAWGRRNNVESVDEYLGNVGYGSVWRSGTKAWIMKRID